MNLLTVGLSYNTVGAVLMCRQRRLFRSSVVWKGVQGGGRYQRSESRERQTQRSEGCLWHRQTKSLAKVVVVVVVKKNNDTTKVVTARYKVWTLVVGGDLTDLAKGLGGDSSNHP